jgi:hypothetical protein
MSDFNEHHTKPCLCPRCGYMLDAATNILRSEGPEASDVSMCLSCGAVLEFRADTTLREMTAPEIAALPRYMRAIMRKAEDARRTIIPPEGIAKPAGKA